VLLSHTYILIKQKTGYVHEKCSTEWEINFFSPLLCRAMNGDHNVSIEIWNVNTHRYGTTNAIERWNSKLRSIIGKQQPNVFRLVKVKR
jgi:hypothetical protein